MGMVRVWPLGRIGLAIAVIGIVCGATRAQAQVEPIVHAQIGLVEFQVPKDFVTSWVKRRQFLHVKFSYPEIEPLGLFRFGHENVKKWVAYDQSLMKRGGKILNVMLEPIRDPKPLPNFAEAGRFLEALCRGLHKGTFDPYSEYDVDFFRCRSEGHLMQAGHHQRSSLRFFHNTNQLDWRVSRRNLDERTLTQVHFSKENLKDWQAITARAFTTVDSWRK